MAFNRVKTILLPTETQTRKPLVETVQSRGVASTDVIEVDGDIPLPQRNGGLDKIPLGVITQEVVYTTARARGAVRV